MVDKKVCEDRHFSCTVSSLSLQIPDISMSPFYDIVRNHLGFRKAGAHWVPKMLTEEQIRKHVVSALGVRTSCTGKVTKC